MIRRSRSLVVLGLAAGLFLALSALDTACSNSANGGSQSGGTALGKAEAADSISDGKGHTLKTFVQPTDPGPGGFVFTASGEVNAVTGYPYPPFDPSQTWMVDGWNWKIEKYIVVIDHITLWSDPNKSPSDQSQHGSQVAHANGPWVIDLHKGGPIDGKGGGGEQSLAVTTIANQNDNGGQAFDPTIQYGFGFSTVQAPGDGSAINVNLTSGRSRLTTSTW